MASERSGSASGAGRLDRPPGAPPDAGRAVRRAATSARFLWRSLSVRGSAFLLALLAIVVGATVASAMLNMRADLDAKMSRELRRFGPNLLVTPAAVPEPGAGAAAPAGNAPPRVEPPGASATLDERTVMAAESTLRARMPDANPDVVPMLLAGGTVALRPGAGAAQPGEPAAGRPDARTPAGDAPPPPGESGTCPATIVGSSFVRLQRLQSSWRLSGTWPDASRADEECLAGEVLARCAGLRPGLGAIVRLSGVDGERSVSCTVAGVLSTGESEDQEMFVALPALQEALGARGRLSLAAVSIDGGEDRVARAAAQLGHDIPGSEARPLRQVAAAQGALLAKLDRMMLLLTVVVLVLTGLCLLTTLTAIVVERQGEIGLMRSIGAGDGQILGMFVGELGLLGLVGSVAGFGLGAAGARIIGYGLFGTAIAPRLSVAPQVVLISLGLCLVSVLLPLRRALRVQPAAALRGD